MTKGLERAPAEDERRPLSVVVADQLRDAILSGELADGSPLPAEKELSGRLGVGRSTIREALRILQAKGLISVGRDAGGPTVSAAGALPGAASAFENVVALQKIPLADLVQLRLVIEEAALRAAAVPNESPARDRAIARAADALEAMDAAGDDAESFLRADVEFHSALIDASGNVAFSLVMDVLRYASAAHLRGTLADEGNLPAMLVRLRAEHEAILYAVRRGHTNVAARAVHDHISGFYARHLDV